MDEFNKPSSSSSFMESIRKLTNPDESAGSDTPKSTNSMTWSELHPASPMYESPSFVGVLAGSPTIPAVSSHAVSPGEHAKDNQISFRSPPVHESSSLMELQTVTPSRVGISPKTILKKVDDATKDTDVSDVPPLSSIFLPEDLLPPEPQRHPSPLANIRIHNSSSVASGSSQKVGMEQFRIVIGGSSPEASMPEDDADIEIPDTNVQPSTSKSKNITFSHDSDEEVDRRNVKDIQEDLNIDQDLLTEGRKVARKGTSTKLPRELRGLMGEANLRYARGEHDVTIKMCLEVIRLAPYAAEPFETLAMIYEERGETKKALQYSLLAAHVSPTDAEQWVHLAQMCLQQKDQFKALNCFCKAFYADRTNVEVALQCAEMYKDFGSCSNALPKYKAAMAAMKNPDKAVQLARDAAKSFHAKRENWFGAEMLEDAMTRHPLFFKDEDINMLCELLLLCGKFSHVLRALMKHSGIVLRFEDEIQDRSNDEDYSGLVGISIPNSLAVDLRCKLAVAMIRLNKSQLVDDMVQNICEQDPADIGDLQFDLAETFMDVKDYSKALTILDILVSSPRYGLAAVWLRHADCSELCGHTEKALFSYRQCINLAPGYVHTYLVYSSVLRKLGRYDIAIQALDEATGYECNPKLRMKLHIERYNVLKSWGESGRKDKLTVAADEALLLFGNRLKTSLIDRNLVLVRRRRSSTNPLSGEVMLVREKTTGGKPSQPSPHTGLASDGNTAVLNKDEWMEMFEVTMEMLVTCKRYRDAANLGEAAQFLSVWGDNPTYRLPIDYITFSACMLGGLYQSAYTYIKSWVKQHPEKNQLWNLFCQVTARTEDQRHHRFCLRFLSRLPDHHVLGIMSGHILLASGSYRNALAEYVKAHKKAPDDPLLLMLIGTMFIHIASQKFSEQKNSLIVQGLAFMQKYLKVRGITQECYYNIGRTLHQLGLEHFAVHYYERALECPPPTVIDTAVDSKVAPAHVADNSLFDLKCEIAYNLSLIHRRSGNHAVANDILAKHCII